jgi:hypothetical protein
MYTYFCYVPRPTSVDKVRVNPSDLRTYRMAYQMLGPCCLCPFINVMGPDFVEAAIYMVSALLPALEVLLITVPVTTVKCILRSKSTTSLYY